MEWLTIRFGFSPLGAIFLGLLLVPNLLWAGRKPQGYDPHRESRGLRMLERLGQVMVSSMVLCFANCNVKMWDSWSWWLALAAGLMVLYEGFWLRYFRGGHTLQDFYGNFCGIPAAGSVLPVLAFFCLGIYGKTLWLLLAVIVLGIGHIGIHLQHRKAAFRAEE